MPSNSILETNPWGYLSTKLENNLEMLNSIYKDIDDLFVAAGVDNFNKLPKEKAERGQFAKHFKMFNDYLETVKIQGLVCLKFEHEDRKENEVSILLTGNNYLILALHYK